MGGGGRFGTSVFEVSLVVASGNHICRQARERGGIRVNSSGIVPLTAWSSESSPASVTGHHKSGYS